MESLSSKKTVYVSELKISGCCYREVLLSIAAKNQAAGNLKPPKEKKTLSSVGLSDVSYIMPKSQRYIQKASLLKDHFGFHNENSIHDAINQLPIHFNMLGEGKFLVIYLLVKSSRLIIVLNSY